MTKRLVLMVVTALVALSPITGSAQPVADAAVVSPEPVSDPWALYESAVAAMAAGRDDEALSSVARLKERHPGAGVALLGAELERHILARRTGVPGPMAAELRTSLDAGFAVPPPPPVTVEPSVKRYATLGEALRDEQPSTQSRAEFVLFQTLHGIALANEFCVVVECSDPRQNILASLLGGGLGVWGSLQFSRGGITAGHVLAIDSGTLWGAWHGIMLNNIADVSSTQGQVGMVMGGQLLGTVGGHLLWDRTRAGAGDVSLVNSAGIWTTITAALIGVTAGWSPSDRARRITYLAASDVGLVGGAFLSKYLPMGRGRSLVIDAGGILGGLVGMGVYAISTSDVNEQVLAGVALGGVLAGLGTAGWFSRDWDASSFPLQLGVAPTAGGLMLTVASAP